MHQSPAEQSNMIMPCNESYKAIQSSAPDMCQHLPTTANVKNAIVEEVAVWTVGLNCKKWWVLQP